MSMSLKMIRRRPGRKGAGPAPPVPGYTLWESVPAMAGFGWGVHTGVLQGGPAHSFLLMGV